MAKAQHPPVHPGDIVQITDKAHPLYRALGTVEESRRWGVGYKVGAVSIEGELVESYQRAKLGQIAVVGVALLVSPEVQKAREQSLATAALVAKDAAK